MRARAIAVAAWLGAASVVAIAHSGARADERESPGANTVANPKAGDGQAASSQAKRAGVPIGVNRSADPDPSAALSLPVLTRADAVRTVQTVALFGLISLAPIGLLMITAFVRINIVLILLRQALGSPQVPGNQILTALAVLLTALVMRPQAEEVYQRAIKPYAEGQVSAAEAWKEGARPIKAFMVNQIVRTKHQDYLEALYDYTFPRSPGRVDPMIGRTDDLPLRAVAPAYLLSELSTALLMGFYVYLPFLVIDLVVSSVLAATGLLMLPPALVSTPVKLIVFVLADGWFLTASMLLSSFAAAPGGP
jgi:flagellar biosynthetic protein FliP